MTVNYSKHLRSLCKDANLKLATVEIYGVFLFQGPIAKREEAIIRECFRQLMELRRKAVESK